MSKLLTAAILPAAGAFGKRFSAAAAGEIADTSSFCTLNHVREVQWLEDRQLGAWRGLLQMHGFLSTELARRLSAESSLSYPEYEVLVYLTDHGGGRLRVYELAELLGWEKSRVSHQVTRMAERGLVTKIPCVDDRRGSFVEVTREGRAEIEAAAPGHVEAVRDLFVNRLTDQQMDQLIQVTHDVLRPRAEPA
jgi:DNA-binding MarR family transcriptional regulator